SPSWSDRRRDGAAQRPPAVGKAERREGGYRFGGKDAAKVALGIMDWAGLAAVTEQRVAVGLVSDMEVLARIKLLAERNGVPLAQLLGDRHAKLIDAAAVDVTPH